jgi:hypothetical protein
MLAEYLKYLPPWAIYVAPVLIALVVYLVYNYLAPSSTAGKYPKSVAFNNVPEVETFTDDDMGMSDDGMPPLEPVPPAPRAPASQATGADASSSKVAEFDTNFANFSAF